MKDDRLSQVEAPDPTVGVTWVGALSFEERCIGSLESLVRLGVPLSSTKVIAYPTHAEPRSVDVKRRRAHHHRMLSLLRESGSDTVPEAQRPRTIHPYRQSDFDNILGRISRETTSRLVVDITCLTKAHTLALGAWLARDGLGRDVVIAYSLPRQYVTPAQHQSRSRRWIEVVLAPFDVSPATFNEKANGLALLGHEGSRLSAAVGQISPIDATFIVAQTTHQEELEVVTRTANAPLLSEIEQGEHANWLVVSVNHTDTGAVTELAANVAAQAVSQNRRLVLFPFGPKPLVLAAAFGAAIVCLDRLWYCYPVPKHYDVDYTKGIGTTEWFRIN